MWLEPKVDWLPSDYVNVEDFNRIKGNLEYLKEMGIKSFKYFELKEPLVKDVTYSSYAYNELWNNLENALQDIIDNTIYLEGNGNKKEYMVLDKYIDYNELNRIERNTLKYYNLFKSVIDNIPTLSITLGDYGGIKL